MSVTDTPASSRDLTSRRNLTLAVVGASGNVGAGIAAVAVEREHRVLAIARDAERLAARTAGLPLHRIFGSVANESSAAQLRSALAKVSPRLDAVVVSINGPRHPAPLMTQDDAALGRILDQDLISHFSAAQAFLPLLEPGGILLGIGGGSCDFVLEGGIPQSVAQAGLRMLYRGMAAELQGRIRVQELIVASVVNSPQNRSTAHASWVTDREIGAQVCRMLENPADFEHPIWRIARRDASGLPVVSHEGPSRLQGFASHVEHRP